MCSMVLFHLSATAMRCARGSFSVIAFRTEPVALSIASRATRWEKDHVFPLHRARLAGSMLVVQRRARRVEVTRRAADPLSVGGGRRGRKPPARGSERRGRHLRPARRARGHWGHPQLAAGLRRRALFDDSPGCAAKQKRRRGHPHVRTSQRRRRTCPRTSPRASRRARASTRGRPPSRLAALPRREPGRDSRRDPPGRTAVVRSPRATAASRARLASRAARRLRHDLTFASP